MAPPMGVYGNQSSRKTPKNLGPGGSPGGVAGGFLWVFVMQGTRFLTRPRWVSTHAGLLNHRLSSRVLLEEETVRGLGRSSPGAESTDWVPITDVAHTHRRLE